MRSTVREAPVVCSVPNTATGFRRRDRSADGGQAFHRPDDVRVFATQGTAQAFSSNEGIVDVQPALIQ
jgi:hypothetical protein